jgi:hypothetical protein
MPANLPVKAGDLLGLEVTPGAVIGVSDAPDAATARWFGPIVLTVRAVEPHSPPLDRELLLRVEYVPGAHWHPAGEVVGPAAAEAPAGRLAAHLDLGRPDLRVELRQTATGVVVDLLKRGRRVARAQVPDARSSGSLVSFTLASVRFGKPIVRLSWRNADGDTNHDYEVDGETIVPLS